MTEPPRNEIERLENEVGIAQGALDTARIDLDQTLTEYLRALDALQKAEKIWCDSPSDETKAARDDAKTALSRAQLAWEEIAQRYFLDPPST